jgi:hypothetical protein
MGQKVNPISLRLGKTNKNYNSLWFGELNYGEFLKKEILAKNYLERFLIQIGETPGEMGILPHPKKEKILSCYLLVDSSRTLRFNRFRLKNFSPSRGTVTPFLTSCTPNTPFQGVTSYLASVKSSRDALHSAQLAHPLHPKGVTHSVHPLHFAHPSDVQDVKDVIGTTFKVCNTGVLQARILSSIKKGESKNFSSLLWAGFLFRLSLFSTLKDRRQYLKNTRAFKKDFFLRKALFPKRWEDEKNGIWNQPPPPFHFTFSFWNRWKKRFPAFIPPSVWNETTPNHLKIKSLSREEKVHSLRGSKEMFVKSVTSNTPITSITSFGCAGCAGSAGWTGTSITSLKDVRDVTRNIKRGAGAFPKDEPLKGVRAESNRWTPSTLLSTHIESILETISKTPTTVHFWKSFWDGGSAIFLAREIAFYLQKRIPFSKIRREILREISENRGKVWNCVEGIRVSCSGRSGGKSKKAQRGKSETFYWGRNSSSLFLSRVGFAKSSAFTQMGLIGVKVWISYK